MGKTDPKIKAVVRKFKQRLARHLAVQKVLLFGSRATGKAKPWSDIDIVVISKNFSKYQKHRERIEKMYDYWDFEYPVDFLCYTPQEFKILSKKITIAKTASEEGIEI